MQGIDEYKSVGDQYILDDLVQSNTGLVLKLAKFIKRKLPSYIELDDLVQAGYIGLLEASKSYRQESGASFETYAAKRIKGSILDELRKNSWNNRDTLTKLKQIAHATNKIEQEKLREATSEEVAIEMNMTLEEFDNNCQIINASNITCMGDISDLNSIAEQDSPEEAVINNNLKETIKASLQNLPERELILMSLYYNEELTFKEISEVLDLTEARVSQLHASILAKLALRIKIT